MIVATPDVPLHDVVPHPALVTTGQTVAMAGVVLPDLTCGEDLREALAQASATARVELRAHHLAPGPIPAVSLHRKPRALAELHALERHLHACGGARDAEEGIAALVVDLERTWEKHAGLVLVTLAGSTLATTPAVPVVHLAGASS